MLGTEASEFPYSPVRMLEEAARLHLDVDHLRVRGGSSGHPAGDGTRLTWVKVGRQCSTCNGWR